MGEIFFMLAVYCVLQIAWGVGFYMGQQNERKRPHDISSGDQPNAAQERKEEK